MSVSLPDPVVRRPEADPADTGALQRDPRRRVDGEVRFDAGSRAAYSTDASNYRQSQYARRVAGERLAESGDKEGPMEQPGSSRNCRGRPGGCTRGPT